MKDNFIYNVEIRFQDMGGITGCLVSDHTPPVLILPENWTPANNEKSKCDVVITTDTISFEGQDVLLAFARLSPIFSKSVALKPPVDWKKKLQPYALDPDPDSPRPPQVDFAKEGDVVLLPTQFYSDGTLRINLKYWQDEGTEEDQRVVRVTSKLRMPTKHFALSKIETGKVALVRKKPHQKWEDVAFFRVRYCKESHLILTPKFLPHAQTLKYFQVPKEFIYKKLDFKV